MSDDLGLFADTPDDGSGQREAARRAPRRRLVTVLAVVLGLAIIGGGAWYALHLFGGFGYDDYAGNGESDVVVQVEPGDSTSAIATRLAEHDVVASPKAFVKAGANNPKVTAIQPGYYLMKTKMSGAAAVQRITEPNAKVGSFEVRGGMQLDDTSDNAGKVYEGILAKISKASCTQQNGESTCVPAEELRAAMEKTNPKQLGVPDWALPSVAKAEPKRRLEGLIIPGIYYVKPGSSAEELLRDVLKISTERLQAAGIPGGAVDTGFTPYEVLTVASLVEKEAVTKDFAKVSRVTYNRLAINKKLEYDSTINYVLDKQHITTSDADRGRPGPYNSYLTTGLPPTPISAPSKDAINAAIKPTPGPWLFFVKCQKDGTTCFAETFEEQQANERKARANGAF
ncbi:hypothetical protein GCM10012275_48960 [Longimycelium tulufanense]|uniref:Endolytic murein transglycosylase n=1 Tax=Longimycelium tulufanense TaxID=907463 RepID=A0A8J3CIP3_9PSEU|nr:endolytic transglycosylase MltG [Longimycelium tulufanense]GGM72563.1 hypothetical protein GCM10012275_48960 [Longimycelium tulufanense]